MEKTLSNKQKTLYSIIAIAAFLVLVYLGDSLIVTFVPSFFVNEKSARPFALFVAAPF